MKEKIHESAKRFFSKKTTLMGKEDSGRRLTRDERVRKINPYTKYLMVILTLQVLLMFLNLAFALWGEYMHGYSSNIWAIIWNKGLIGLWTLLAGLVTVVSGITGIVIHKGNKIQCVLSVVTIASIIPGLICFIFAIGSKF